MEKGEITSASLTQLLENMERAYVQCGHLDIFDDKVILLVKTENTMSTSGLIQCAPSIRFLADATSCFINREPRISEEELSVAGWRR